MTNNNADVAGAVTALSTVLESMERRQADIASRLNDANQRRRAILDQRVLTLLPDISHATMNRLQQEVPKFVADYGVLDTLIQNRKVLWLFKPSGYDEALTLLQSRLKRYLEQQELTRDEDQIIVQLESEKARLAAQQSEALQLLSLMEKAHRAEVRLPQKAVTSINHLAERGRTLGSRQQIMRSSSVSTTHIVTSHSSSSQVYSDSDTDLWLWMMSDIPTSFRTLMWHSFSDYPDTNSNGSPVDSCVSDGGNTNSGDVLDNFIAMTTQTTTQCAPDPIATDDRLGAFS